LVCCAWTAGEAVVVARISTRQRAATASMVDIRVAKCAIILFYQAANSICTLRAYSHMDHWTWLYYYEEKEVATS
jgi:hypothetical protein